MDKSSRKTVVLGVTGCIGAYKSIEIMRQLQKMDYDVQVVMTRAATCLVGPLTFKALSGNDVVLDLFDCDDAIAHISLAKRADLFLVAPCTVNTAAKIAHGIADNALTSAAIACTAPVVLAVAANVNMYENAATQDNFTLLKSRGIHLIEAGVGRLACGDVGKGVLASVDEITASVHGILSQD